MDYNLEELKWKCQDCDASAPPTSYDYMKLLKHQKGHHIRLVNTKTGEILATSVKHALSNGIDIPSDGKPPGKVEVKSGEKAELGMELTEEGIILPVTLPPVVFTMFDAAKAAKLVDEDKDLDSWLFECVQKRFELDYNLRLMLVPIGEGK